MRTVRVPARLAALGILLVLATQPLAAQSLDLSPSRIAVSPGATSQAIATTLLYEGESIPTSDGIGTLGVTVAGLEGHFTTVPSPVQYAFFDGIPFSVAAFQIQLATTAPPGIYTVEVTDLTTPLAGQDTLQLRVRGDLFDFDVSPQSLSLTPGVPTPVLVTPRPAPGFDGSINFSITGLPPAIRISPAKSTSKPPYRPFEIMLTADPGARPGPFSGEVVARAPGGFVKKPIRITSVARPGPTFMTTVSPQRVVLSPAAPIASVSVQTAAPAGFAETVRYRIEGLPPFFRAEGLAGPVAPPYSPLTLRLSLLASAPAGTYPVTIVGQASTLSPTETRTLLEVVVDPDLPTIRQVVPSALTSGTQATVRILGENFVPRATVESSSPAVIVRSVRVVSSSVAAIDLRVAPNAPAGPVALELINPDGRRSEPDGRLLVVASDSPVAPLGVTTASVVYPRPGMQLPDGAEVRARGLLATTGTGTITGSWQLDGIPFERFGVQAVAGGPSPIESRTPIPQLERGLHRLQLVVEQPLRVESPSVEVLLTGERDTTFRPLGPGEGSVIGAETPTFRWAILPGVSGYEVEFEQPLTLESVRFRTTENRWRATALDRERIDPGEWHWRVRPIYPGSVRGTATADRTVFWLPERVEIVVDSVGSAPDSGALEVVWGGGSPGVLYQVELLGTDDRVLFTGLTLDRLYRVPAMARPREPFAAIRIRALGPQGETLGDTGPVELRTPPATGPQPRPVRSGDEQQLVEAYPPPGSDIGESRPFLFASWTGAVDSATVLLLLDGVDVTQLADWTEVTVALDAPTPLDIGEHRVSLVLGDQELSWGFQIVPNEGDGLSYKDDVDDGSSASRVASNLQLSLEGGVDAAGGDDERPETGRVGFSVMADRQSDRSQLSANADAAWGWLDGGGTLDLENQNWILAPSWLPVSLTGGYTPPALLDRLELVTGGLTRGGIEAALDLSNVRVSFHQSFDPDIASTTSGDLGPEQDLRAAAVDYQAPSGRFSVRAVGLQAEDPATEYQAARETRNFGLLAQVQLDKRYSLVMEGAWGDLEQKAPPPDAAFFFGEPTRSTSAGEALRLGLTGHHGLYDLRVAIRHVDGDFANLANPGLTSGGRSDRNSIEADVRRRLAKGSIGVEAQLVQGDESLNRGSQVGALRLSYSRNASQRFQLSASANWNSRKARGDEEHFLPAVDGREWGLDLNLLENVSGWQLSQTIGYRTVSDDIDSFRDVDNTTVSLNFGRSIAWVQLHAGLTGYRVDSVAGGRTDSWTFSLQPTMRIAKAHLLVSPYLTYSENQNKLFGTDATTEQYQLRVAYSPPWLADLVSLEAATAWARSRDRGIGFDPGFDQRHTLSVVLRWGRSIDRPAPPMSSHGRGTPRQVAHTQPGYYG